MPIPHREVTEEETPPEEEAIDILSISELPALEEPPAELPPDQPLTSEPSAQDQLIPPDLDQPVVLEETPIDEPLLEEEKVQENNPLENEGSAQFDPARQSTLLGQTGGINVEFDGTADFPQNIWELGYLQSLNLECFFAEITPNRYRLLPPANQLKFFRRNYGLVVTEDLPLTFTNQTLIEVPDRYCGEQLFEIQDNGVPTLFVSTLRIGPGNPPASIILIFWTADPRG
ncbi:MAG: hypothetical protein AAGD09_00495 [Cyanobacteria bacterium P01_F01_bin.56]